MHERSNSKRRVTHSCSNGKAEQMSIASSVVLAFLHQINKLVVCFLEQRADVRVRVAFSFNCRSTKLHQLRCARPAGFSPTVVEPARDKQSRKMCFHRVSRDIFILRTPPFLPFVKLSQQQTLGFFKKNTVTAFMQISLFLYKHREIVR